MPRRARVIALLAVAALAAAGAARASAPSFVRITIRHQLQHCHAWSANGGAFEASLTVPLARGGTIAFANDDVMPHRLVELAGPAISLPPAANMNRMMAGVAIRFSKPGTYRFKTIPGEDYMSGMRTVGADNVLTLTVHVG